MSYVDAYLDRTKEMVYVVERVNGERIFTNYKPEYSFYYPDPNGEYESIFGQKLKKFQAENGKAFNGEKKNFGEGTLFESDIKPVFKVLEKHYLDADIPEVHKASIDIEVDFCEERGFASPEDPHQPITAVSVNFDWLDKLVTLVIAPKGLNQKQAQTICEKFDNCLLCEDEKELIKMFYEIIEDVDILYTWNGEGFDIPYIINRTIKVFDKNFTRKLCLWNVLPKKREFERYGKSHVTYDIVGRVHLDYMQLYRKYTYHEMHSYSLDAIGEYELGENKIPYDGTLDQLYNEDFEKFIEYNRQDVKLLSKLDNKLKFINLANVLAHDNCILFQTTMGAVALTDQAIVLEAHRQNKIVPDRRRGLSEGRGIVGGYVADPKPDMWKWIGSVDINSLYPSVIRALNMSPETLIAQVEPTMTDAKIDEKINHEGLSFADAWNNTFTCSEYDEIMERRGSKLLVKFEHDGTVEEMSAREIRSWVFDNDDLCMSANGTIFRTDIQGIIPGLLTKWYAQRKEMQAEKRKYQKQLDKEKDAKKKKELQAQVDFWDQRQLVTKIKLNSLYGAVSNVASRFADQRIGQSTTLTGRSITKHMNATVNKILTGTEDYRGDCIVYSDTDSSYFSVMLVEQELKSNGFDVNKESFVELCETIADQVNESFPEYVQSAFNIQGERSKLIKCGRENCALRGIYPRKKRYAILVYDQEGTRFDVDDKPGKLKIMGMDTQRADTPKSIQEFLKDVLIRVLRGDGEQQVLDFIREFRAKVKDLSPWELGTPKRVNNLWSYQQKMKTGKKITIPGHVRASINWNNLREMHNDHYSMPIVDGQKVVVCYLKENPLKMTSVAYPIDEGRLPDWFKQLPFDVKVMEGKLIDKKLNNVIGSLKWDLEMTKTSAAFADFFKLED